MSTLHVTVYGAPGCFRCSQTVRRFQALGVEPEVIDITTNEKSGEQLREAGFQTLPVVTTGEDTWTGFRLDRIRAAAAKMTGEHLAS